MDRLRSGERPVARRGELRVNGLAVLAAIVLVGLLTGAVFYRWKRAETDARVEVELEAAPRTSEERAALWLRFSGPQIHHRLAVVARFAPELPWLVTHAFAMTDGPPEVWGIDCAQLPKALAHLEGLTVVVELPHPRPLGRIPLAGERARRVPLFAREASPDAATRLTELALYLLEGIPRALERDVPGASLVIRVAKE